MNRRFVLSLLIICLGSADAADDRPIASRDPWAIRFSGMEAFNEDSVRRALVRDRDVRKAQGSNVDDAEFLSLLQSLVAAGVKSNGFPEAVVSVSKDEREIIHVRADPGALWKWGKPKVVVAHHPNSVAAVARFLDNWSDAEFRVWSGVTGWNSLRPVNTSRKTQHEIQSLANVAAQRDFLEGFQCEVEFDFQAAEKEVVPVIQVSQTGYHTLVSELIFEGNVINSDEVLKSYLHVPENARFDGQLSDHIRRRLLNSGRILHVELACDASFAADHAVPLRIAVHEREGAPPLNAPLPDAEQAICRLAAWLSDWRDPSLELQIIASTCLEDADAATVLDDSPADRVTPDPDRVNPLLSLTDALRLNGAANIKCTYTAGKSSGSIVRLEVSDADGHEVCHYGIVHSTEAIGVSDFLRKKKWTRSVNLPSITNRVQLVGTASPERPRRIVFSPGINSLGNAPVYTRLDVEPAALISDLLEKAGSARPVIEDGICSITTPQVSVRFEADSGRLLQLKSAAKACHIEVVCGTGLLTKEISRVSDPSMEEHCVSGRDLSTLVRFLLPYAREQFLKGQDATLAALVDRSLSEGSSLDRLFNQILKEEDKLSFSIPSDNTPARGAASPWFLQWVQTASAPGSSFDRLLALLDDNLGDPEVQDAFLSELHSHHDIGPAACLCLSWVCPGIKRQIAEEGLRRLNVESFRHDIRLIIAENAAFHDFAFEVIKFIREMNPDEVELVAVAVERLTAKESASNASIDAVQDSVGQGINVRPVFAMIRMPGVSAEETMDSVMVLAWERLVRDQLFAHLARQAGIHSTHSRTATVEPQQGQKE